MLMRAVKSAAHKAISRSHTGDQRSSQMRRLTIASLAFSATLFLPLSAPPQSMRAEGDGKSGKPSAPAPEHDLSGVWLIISRAQSLSKDPPPFTPEGEKRFNANIP